MENVAADAVRAAAHQEQGTVFRITKQTCGGSYSSNTSIRDKQGNVLTSDKEQERRWAEHVEEMLNRDNPPDLPMMCDVSSPIQYCHRLVMKKTMDGPTRGIRWNLFSSLEDIDFADDVTLLSHIRQHLQEKINKLNDISQILRLKINQKKSKVMGINQRNR